MNKSYLKASLLICIPIIGVFLVVGNSTSLNYKTKHSETVKSILSNGWMFTISAVIQAVSIMALLDYTVLDGIFKHTFFN